jgi:hypothetical protein
MRVANSGSWTAATRRASKIGASSFDRVQAALPPSHSCIPARGRPTMASLAALGGGNPEA